MLTMTETPKGEEKGMDLEHLEFQDIRSNHPFLFFFGFILPALGAIFSGFVVFLFPGMLEAPEKEKTPLIIVAVAFGMIPLIILQTRARRKLPDFVEKIGKRFGLTYAPKGESSTLVGPYFNHGTMISSHVTHILSGVVDGVPVRTFYHQWSEGKHQRMLTGVEIQTGVELPFILVEPAAFRFVLHASTQYPGIAHHLEGDFSRRFSVVAPESYGSEIREMLSPDVMALFLDKYRQHTFICSGDRIYLCRAEQLTNERKYVALYENAIELYRRMKPFFQHALPKQ